MRYPFFTGLLSFVFISAAVGSDSEPHKPCTIFSPITGAYYDLNTITVLPPEEQKKAHKDEQHHSWKAKGYDYGTNFTINFCAPVIESLEDVVGVEESLWKNISAFYTFGGKTYSIGWVLRNGVGGTGGG
jgi:cation-dependent mannose-6-phosphate receptor